MAGRSLLAERRASLSAEKSSSLARHCQGHESVEQYCQSAEIFFTMPTLWSHAVSAMEKSQWLMATLELRHTSVNHADTYSRALQKRNAA